TSEGILALVLSKPPSSVQGEKCWLPMRQKPAHLAEHWSQPESPDSPGFRSTTHQSPWPIPCNLTRVPVETPFPAPPNKHLAPKGTAASPPLYAPAESGQESTAIHTTRQQQADPSLFDEYTWTRNARRQHSEAFATFKRDPPCKCKDT